jgi:tyrosyl-tRNA synthetase
MEGRNPREAKVALAQEIVARFHSQAAAEHALAEFEARFRQGALPEDIVEVTLQTNGVGIGIGQLAKQSGVSLSTSDVYRLIDQGGLKLDGERVTDRGLTIPAGTTVVVQAGKRKFARVTVR